jgi:hypothetical protein
MVIYNFNVRRAVRTLWPLETNAPLLVDTNAVLASPIRAKRFQSVTWQRPQILKACCRFQNFKPFAGLRRKTLKVSNKTSIGKGLSSLIAVTQDHGFR